METSPKASKATRQLVALLTAGATLAMAALVGASSSTQVAPLAPLVVPRTGHAATALAPSDGRILITGGRDSAGNIVAVSEIFDPSTGTSTPSAVLTTPRVNHTATLLNDGRVLVAGGTAGGTGSSGPVNTAEIFDPATGFQMVGATMGAARSGHTATLLSDGTVLLAGGDTAGTAEIFDPTAGTFSPTLLNMAAPRTGHTATLFSDHSVLFAGGGTASMEWFDPTQKTFTLDSQVLSAVHAGQEAISLSDTRLLFFGGDASNTIEEFNRTADTVTTDATMTAASSSSTLLANGNILVLGASMAGIYAPNATDPSTAFTAFDETSVPGSSTLLRTGQTATELSGDKRILVAGGVNAQNLFVDPALFNAARIWTDKDDYAPGDNVILSGSGWKPNENVYLYAVDDTTEAWTYGSTVAADANGGFIVNPFFIVQLVQAGANFSVSAVGAQSAMQANVKFTDSKPAGVTVGPPNSVSVTPGGTANYTVTVTFGGNSGSCTSDLSVLSGLPPGVTLGSPDTTFTPSSVTSTGTAQTSSLAITTHAGTVPGSYTFTVQAVPTATCQSGSSTQTGTGVLVVNAPPAITSATNTTFTVNSPGTFTVTATGVPAPTFSETGALPSGVTLNPTTGVIGGTPALGTVGNYPITITAHNGIAPDATQSFTLTVQKATATVTITPGSLNANYSASPQTVNVNTSPNGLSVSITYNGSLTAPTNAGSYSVVATVTDLNYTGSASGTLVINKANATVTVTPYNVTFNNLSHTATGTATGIAGANLSGLDLSGTTHTAVGDYTSDPWTFSNINYNSQSGTVHDVISAATTMPTVTVSFAASSIPYDGNAHPATAKVTGVGGVDITTGHGNVTITYTPGGTSPPVNAGIYTASATFASTDSNYTDASSTIPASLTINKKAISYTIGDDSHVYGSTTTFSTLATSFPTGVNSETLSIGSYASTGNTTMSNVGTYPITGVVSNGTGLASNYDVTLTPGTLTVNKKAISYTIGNDSHVYGSTTTFSTLATSFPTGVNSETLSIGSYASTGNTTMSNVGTYPITGVVSNGTGLASNYDVTLTPGTLTVNKKAISYTIGNDSHVYGSTANLATDLGATFLTGVNGESLSIAYSSDGNTTTSNVGTYDITGVVSNGSGLASNYSVALTNGTLTVNKKAISYTIGNASHDYGSTVNLATVLGTTFDTGVNGENLSIAYSSTGNTTISNAGTYTITGVVSNGTGLASNYDVALTNGVLTVNKVHLTVTADNKTKIYDGNPYSPFTATLTGFVLGQTDAGLRLLGDLSGAAGFGGTGDTAVGAFLPGTWTIVPTQGTLMATNYDFTPFVNGTLTITFGTCSGSTPGGVILQPINSDGSSVFPKAGRTVPVKFTVCDANGNPISDPMVVFGNNTGSITLLSAVRGTVNNVDETAANDIPDVAFRFSSGIWIFNMATSNLQSGSTYTFQVNLKYGSITFKIGIK